MKMNQTSQTDTDPNQEVDFIAQVEHHCCTAALVMVIPRGAEVYLDERLQLSRKKV